MTVIVDGDFTVVGGANSAAVPHPDGSHRRLYCVKSPESWFEDFGEASLDCGEAMIPLVPNFAAVVDTSKYHVFVTGYDMHADLVVFDRTADGFRVRAKERVGACSRGASWRSGRTSPACASSTSRFRRLPNFLRCRPRPDPPAVPTREHARNCASQFV